MRKLVLLEKSMRRKDIMNLQWKKITLDDEKWVKEYYWKENTRSCENTFGNNILWSEHFDISYTILDGLLVFLSQGDGHSVSFPMGEGNLRKAILDLEEYFRQKKQPFCMHLITKEQFEKLESIFPGRFQISYDRDDADYIYESEKLISLSGKKLHAKRNHINKFIEENPDWTYERITSENKQDCIAMAEKWRELSGCKMGDSKCREVCVTIRALEMYERLEFIGGLIRVKGEVVAFSIGEPLSEDTFVVHIEKAYSDIQGAYPMINQQFVLHEAAGYRYINREDDTGEEGLRKAKLSYYPAFLQEKGDVTIKG